MLTTRIVDCDNNEYYFCRAKMQSVFLKSSKTYASTLMAIAIMLMYLYWNWNNLEKWKSNESGNKQDTIMVDIIQFFDHVGL